MKDLKHGDISFLFQEWIAMHKTNCIQSIEQISTWEDALKSYHCTYYVSLYIFILFTVRKRKKIRNRYNQAPDLTHATNGK